MSGRPHITNLYTTTDVPETGANTETVIATIAAIASEFPSQAVQFLGWVAFTPGAAATAVTVRIRRDALAGTLVNEANANAGDIVAAKLSTIPLNCTDFRAGDYSGNYVLTVQGTGEGGAGNCNASSLTAIVA